MKIGLILLSASLAACATTRCTPTPPPTVVRDGGSVRDAAPPADPMFTEACNNLAAIGCADGKAPYCAVTLFEVMRDRLRPIDVPCMMAAKDVPAARICGATCR